MESWFKEILFVGVLASWVAVIYSVRFFEQRDMRTCSFLATFAISHAFLLSMTLLFEDEPTWGAYTFFFFITLFYNFACMSAVCGDVARERAPPKFAGDPFNEWVNRTMEPIKIGDSVLAETEGVRILRAAGWDDRDIAALSLKAFAAAIEDAKREGFA